VCRRQAQSSSSSRRTAGAAGFLILSQCADRPARYGAAKPLRHDDALAARASHHADTGAVAAGLVGGFFVRPVVHAGRTISRTFAGSILNSMTAAACASSSVAA